MASAILLAALPLAHALVLDNGAGRLPLLGFSSWNAYHCDINETNMLSAANAMVSLGLKDAGYTFVNIDDCWSVKSGRNSTTGRIIPDPTKFPEGISGFADKVHAMGLHVGIYSSAGTETCAGYPASLGYEDIDAQSFAEWGVDFLKYDNCNYPSNWTDTCEACAPGDINFDSSANGTCPDTDGICPAGYNYFDSNSAKRYGIMRDALLAQNRTIQYNICEWGRAHDFEWGNATSNSWRTTPDIDSNWPSIMSTLNINSFLSNYGNFWGHNDPDMLEVGNGNLTDAECRSHFALWALMKAPLVIGTDLTTLSSANVQTLLNKYLLAFNQDPVIGEPAQPYQWGVNPDWTFNSTNPAEYWAGQSSTEGTVVAMMNTLDSTRKMVANLTDIPGLTEGQNYTVTDAWTGQVVGCVDYGLSQQVDSHDTAVLLFKEGC